MGHLRREMTQLIGELQEYQIRESQRAGAAGSYITRVTFAHPGDKFFGKCHLPVFVRDYGTPVGQEYGYIFKIIALSYLIQLNVAPHREMHIVFN